MRGNFRGDAAVVVDAGNAAFGDAADDDGIESPLFEDGKDFTFAAFFGDEQHALLRFAEHDFVGRHARFALGNFGEIDFDAGAAARSHFHGGTGEASGAHILNRDDRASLHGFEAGFEEQLFHEGVADLHVGALLLRLFGEFGGGQQRCAVNSIAASFCADVDDGIADAFGFGEKNFFFFGDAEGERVDQRILGIARLEGDFAADGGNAEAVSVAPHAADDAVEDAAVFRGVRFRREFGSSNLTEAERIENSDGPRAHGENIAENSAYAGSGALERLDVTWMIV